MRGEEKKSTIKDDIRKRERKVKKNYSKTVEMEEEP